MRAIARIVARLQPADGSQKLAGESTPQRRTHSAWPGEHHEVKAVDMNIQMGLLGLQLRQSSLHACRRESERAEREREREREPPLNTLPPSWQLHSLI